MPTPDEILRGLQEIADRWRWLSVFWHAYLGILALWIVLRRPERRVLGVTLALPLFSVSSLAWWSGNPFNGTTFASSGLALALISTRLSGESRPGRPWTIAASGLLFAFGWTYPHFYEASSWLPYLYRAPTGLLPCPTLAMVIGLTLLADGLRSTGGSLVLGAMGLFYGIFGGLRLGVTIDLFLIGGALLLALLPYSWKRASDGEPS